MGVEVEYRNPPTGDLADMARIIDQAAASGIEPVFYGKPFQAIFDLARERIRPGTPDDRVVMVGDTLHTDILGGNAAGFRTALIQGYGFFDGGDPESAIETSGIVPNFILDRP